MSNSGYVVFKKMPSEQEITTQTESIIAAKFPNLLLSHGFNKSSYWEVRHPDDERVGVWFFAAKYGRRPCLQFPHHYSGFPIGWWLEYEIREELACRFEARVADDALGKSTKPEMKRFDTYREYLEFTRAGMLEMQFVIEMELQQQYKVLPENMKKLVGLYEQII